MKEGRSPADAGRNEPEETARGSGAQPRKNRDDVPGIKEISDHFKAAFDRVDGIVMYIDVVIFLITAMVFLLKIILGDTHTERDVFILTVSLFLVPGTMLMYFNLKFTDTILGEDNKFGRTLNAMVLLLIPGCFFYTFFIK
jgi:hypothetical protein